MNADRDSLLSAYLDGELSAAEASLFDSSLTQEERGRLAAEMRLESAMAEALCKNAECPAAVWERVKGQVAAAAKPLHAPRSRKWFNMGLAAAASLVLALAAAYVFLQQAAPPFLTVANDSIEQYEASAETSGDPEAIQGYLDARNMGLTVANWAHGHGGHGSKTDLIGVREELYRGEPVVELLVECCGKPLKIVMAPVGSDAANAIGKAMAKPKKSDIQTWEHFDNYVVALVGTHRTRNLLEFIEETDIRHAAQPV